jgi:hypothetical protein
MPPFAGICAKAASHQKKERSRKKNVAHGFSRGAAIETNLVSALQRATAATIAAHLRQTHCSTRSWPDFGGNSIPCLAASREKKNVAHGFSRGTAIDAPTS